MNGDLAFLRMGNRSWPKLHWGPLWQVIGNGDLAKSVNGDVAFLRIANRSMHRHDKLKVTKESPSALCQ